MQCQRCGNLLQKVLYRCQDCFADDVEDPDMCTSCMREHLEANTDGNLEAHFIEVVY